MEFGWKIVVGTLIGFFGAAFGSVGGVGGGGIFVPMLTLIIGFDQKSSTAISKCKYRGSFPIYFAKKTRPIFWCFGICLIRYDNGWSCCNCFLQFKAKASHT
jgi:hypothetical protein